MSHFGIVGLAAFSRGSHVVVLMSDTRHAFFEADVPPLRWGYPQLAFELNREYACKHGYDVLYLRMVNQTCQHETLGERHSSYCKLAAVGEALARGYSMVVFLDRSR